MKCISRFVTSRFVTGISLFLFIFFSTASVVYAADYDLPDYSTAYDAKRDPFQDGRDAIALAGKTGRFVLIEVGGDWCVWCHLLDRFIKNNKDVYDALHQNYVVLKVNVNDENDNKEFLSGLPKANGYPHLFITRGDGTVIYSTDTTRLVKEGKYVHERVMAFLQHWTELDKKNNRPQKSQR
jgi:thioredoxin-related protein